MFWWFTFIFRNAYKPPPGYVTHQDPQTGNMMYVREKELSRIENVRNTNKYNFKESDQMNNMQNKDFNWENNKDH